MKRAISVHSHKGGTGKTMVSINLAAEFVRRGYNVALIDLDLGAPSLQTYAPNHPENTINDYFLENASLDQIIFDATYLLKDYTGDKKFYLALASIDTEKISAIQHREKQAQLNDLYLLMKLVRNKLSNNPWKVDIVILDTSPGISTGSINSIAASNSLVVLMKLVNGDLEGTREMLKTLNETLNLDTTLLINQIPPVFEEFGGEDSIHRVIQEDLIDKIENSKKIKIGPIIPTSDDILKIETRYALSTIVENQKKARPIQILESPNSMFAQKIREYCDKIVQELEG